MGSERLSHAFTALDPTYKRNSSDETYQSKSHHSLSHTSGTQPVSVSNGPQHSSASSKFKHKRKPNAKYRKLIKLYHRQLAHVSRTLDAIETLSKPGNQYEDKIIAFNKTRVNKLKENLENLCNTPEKQDHLHFEPLKDDIDQLINDLKSYKMDDNTPNACNSIDHLVGLPLDVSDEENNDDTEQTLNYI